MCWRKPYGLGFADPDDAFRRALAGGEGVGGGRVDVAPGPGGDDVGGVVGVGVAAEQVVGVVEGDEALGVLGGGEDGGGVVDADDRVQRGVEDEECAAEIADGVRSSLAGGDVLEKGALDGEGAAAERHLGLALGLDVGERAAEIVGDVGRVGGGADGDDGLGAGDLAGGGEHGGTAQAVADQDAWRQAALLEVGGGARQVLDVGAEVGVGELALAVAEAGEVEAQHGDAEACQALGDAAGGGDVLRAGEAVGEEGGGDGLAVGQVEPGGEHVARVAGEVDPLAAHGVCSVLLVLVGARHVGASCGNGSGRAVILP